MPFREKKEETNKKNVANKFESKAHCMLHIEYHHSDSVVSNLICNVCNVKELTKYAIVIGVRQEILQMSMH